MDAYVITVWRRDGSFQRYVRMAADSAAALNAAQDELAAGGLLVPKLIACVSAHPADGFDPQAALENFLAVMQRAGARAPVPVVESVARVLH